MADTQDIVCFELNNWVPGDYYPDEEPFTTWIGNDCNMYFNDKDWVKENKLCVVMSIIDMSVNFCVTAAKEWVENHCPRLLTRYEGFIRQPEDDNDIYGQFGDKFLEYSEENFGIHHV